MHFRLSIKSLLLATAILGFGQLCTTLVFAQDLYFSTLSVTDGLPSNIISGIAQDENDFIWIGTGNGLARYDGNHFKTFKKNEFTNSLPSNEISCLLEDGDFIWVGTWNGLCKINTRTYEITRVDQAGSNAVRTLAKGLNHSIWIGTENGLIELDGFTNKILKTFHTNNSGLSHNTIRSIYQQKNGTLWVGTYDKLNRLSAGSAWFEAIDIKGNYKPALKNNLICGGIKPYKEGSDSLLWIGTETGLCLFNTITNTYELIGEQQVPFSNEVIKCIYKSEGNLWLGTDFGLNIFDPEKRTNTPYFHNPKTPYSIANNAIWQIYEDRGGVLWFVTSNGLSRLNKYKNIYEFHEVSSQIENQTVGNQVKSILITKSDIVWLASLHGVLRIDKKNNSKKLFDTSSSPENKILLNNAYALEEDSLGRIWIGTAGGINIWDEPNGKMYAVTANPTNGLVTNYIARFIKGSDGSFWVSTYQGGLFKVVGDFRYPYELKFQAVTKEFGSEKVVAGDHALWFVMYNDLFRLDTKTLNESSIEKFNEQSDKRDIHCMFFSKRKILWAGTQNGLIRYNPELNTSEFCPIISGRDVNIGNLQEDDHGNIWGATNYFIFMYNPLDKDTQLFPIDQNLSLKSFYYSCASKNTQGELFFGGDNGYVSIDTKKKIPNLFQPKVYITSLEINNRLVSHREKIDNRVLIENDIAFTQHLSLDYAHRAITFEFSSLHYWQPDMNVFAYKLEGFDEDWIYVSGQKNFAVYSNLSPKKYTFRVKGTNNYGVWSDTLATLDIEVKPPLFLSSPFLLIYAILLIGVVLVGMRMYSTRLKLKNELNITRLEKMHTEELAQAKQQFFTNISHELRTPVSLILPPIHQILKHGNLDTESRSLIRLAEKNSHRLLRVINQILDFRKLENDSLQIKVGHVELVNFCREIQSLFSDRANRKKINFRFTAKVSELKIWIDSEKIETVLFNLLSNAFKFTKHGGTIEVSVYQNERTQEFPEGSVAINITDTGIGLNPEEKVKIFEPFYQTQEARQMEMGTGIGLALAAEYVKLHHGQIQVDSLKGEGTSFTVHLPLGNSHFPVDYIHEEDEIELIAIKENSDNAKTKKTYRFDLQSNKPLVLIIDDSHDMIDLVRISLGHKYNFITAENGEEGLQKANRFLPEIIVSDVMMPVMDGLTLCKKIKENSATSHISIILITARGLTSQKIEGIRTGADVYLTKPFEIEFLEVNIDHLLDRKHELIEYLKNVFNTQSKTEGTKENVDEKFIKKVMNIIEANISDSGFGVEQLSDEVGMSASYLYRKLKSLTQLSTNEIIKKYRLKKASMLLKNKEGNVTEIMYDVGFSNLSYFSKCFKAEFGLNPKDYQQQMSKQSIHLNL